MTFLLLALAVFSANQGSAVQLTFANEPAAKSVEVVWAGRKIPAFLAEDRWTTIVGVDLDTKPGEHKADVLFTREDGSIDKQEAVVKVVAKKYPTTELKVEDKYVELSKPDLARANRESAETERIYTKTTPQRLWADSFTVP